MKKIQLYLMLSVAVFATGCPKYKPQVDFDKNPNAFINRLNTFLREEQERYNGLIKRDPPDTATAKIVRNEAIERVLPYIDSAYMDFITDIQAGRDRDNFIADLVELGGTAAVGIVNGERPLQIIGVGLTAIRGGRRSADLNFYKEQSTPLLITKMDGNRARVRSVILTREGQDVGSYPFGAAISDIVDYYNAGTLVRAFTELQKDTADKTKQEEDNLQVLKGVPLTPEATPILRNTAVSARRVLDNLLNDLNSPDAATKAAATARVQKIIASLEKDPTTATVLKAAGVSSQETDGVKLRAALIGVRTNAADTQNNDVLNKINQAIIENGQ
jgi:hypothetical protein